MSRTLESFAHEMRGDIDRARKAVLVLLAQASPVLSHDGMHVEPLVEIANALQNLEVDINDMVDHGVDVPERAPVVPLSERITGPGDRVKRGGK